MTNGRNHTVTTVAVLAAYHLAITELWQDLLTGTQTEQVARRLQDALTPESPLTAFHANAIDECAKGDPAILLTLFDLMRISLTYVTNTKGGDQVIDAFREEVAKAHKRRGGNFGNVYTFEATELTDDDYGQMFPLYTTYFFVNHDMEQQMQLGSKRKLFGGEGGKPLTAFITGVGKLVITPLVNILLPTNGWRLSRRFLADGFTKAENPCLAPADLGAAMLLFHFALLFAQRARAAFCACSRRCFFVRDAFDAFAPLRPSLLRYCRVASSISGFYAQRLSNS
ncbi:MAG TPA: hypothetical protein VKW06_13060 [Candidatus Angelobacter sp.]|nr:hypothetical protein [Candidatus Angelobacter sp.]